MSSSHRRASLKVAASLLAVQLGSYGRAAAAQSPSIDGRSTVGMTSFVTSSALDVASTARVPDWPIEASIVVGDEQAVWLVDDTGMRRLAPATNEAEGMVVGFPHRDGLVLRESVLDTNQGDGLRLARWDGGGTTVLVDPRTMPTADAPRRFRSARGIWSMSVGQGPDVWFTTTALSDRQDPVGFLEDRPIDDLWRVATTGGPPARVLAPGDGGTPVVAPDGAHVAVLVAPTRVSMPIPPGHRHRRGWQIAGRLGRWLQPVMRATSWICQEPGMVRLVDAATGRTSDVLDVPCIDEGADVSWARLPHVAWSADSRQLRVAVATAHGQAHDARPTRIVDIDAASHAVVSERMLDCQAGGVRWSPSGAWLTCHEGVNGANIRLGRANETAMRVLPGRLLFGWSADETRLIVGGRTVKDPVDVIKTDGRRVARGTYDALHACTWLDPGRLICRVRPQSLELRDLNGAVRRIDGLLGVDWMTLVDPSIDTGSARP